MTEPVYSFCRGCVSFCGLKFDVEDNRIIAMEGDRASPVSEGFKCIKGDMSVQLLQGAEKRLPSSQKRDANGQLQPIATAQMLDEIAAIIKDSIERHGPRSVAMFFGTAGYRKSFNLSIAKQFMGLIGSPLVFSTMTIDQSAHWVTEGRMGMFATGRPFFQDTDVYVFSGTNPVISHVGPYQGTPLVNHTRKFREFRARGGKIVVVDPRKTETAKQADLHLQLRPGTDAALFAGIIHIILANGWHDQAFCDRYVANLDVLKASVAPFTPDVVAERTGLPVEQVREAAQIIGHAKKLSASFGTGTSMAPHPNTSAHLIEALNAICGGFARAGDLVHNPGIFMKRPLVEGVIPPRRSWEMDPKLESGYGTLYGEFPTSRLPDEILREGPSHVRTLIVMGANPIMAFGQPDRLREAFDRLDHLIVVEPRLTETTEYADYIVAPPIQYEVEDFNMMTAGWGEEAMVQYTQPVVQPPPETIEEWQFFNGLAKRLGIVLELTPFTLGDNSAAAKKSLRLDHSIEWTTTDLIRKTFEDAGLSLDEIKRHPHGWKLPDAPQTIAAPDDDDGARLDVCPPDVADEIRQVFGDASPGTRKYRLIPRRIVELYNSEFRYTDTVERRFQGSAPLYIHPDDMAEEGLGAGDRTLITGEHGSIVARVRPDPTMRRGVLSMPHCWNGEKDGDPIGGHTSWLVSLREEHVQKIDGMPQQSSIPVDISRAS